MLTFAPFVIATSLVVAAVAVLLIDALRGILSRAQPAEMPRHEPPVRFLFDRDRMIDTTPSGEVFLSRMGEAGASLKAVIDLLFPQFPDISAIIDRLDKRGEARVLASDGSAYLDVVRNADILRLEIEPVAPPDRPFLVCATEFDALRTEVKRLRGVADSLPYLVWREDSDGRLTWVNRAYLDLCSMTLGPEAAGRWPLPQLFEHPATVEDDGSFAARLWVGSEANGMPFEVQAAPHEGGLLCSAIPAEGAVRAETSMRDVLQTLTKTFAQLSIGLAVFGRDRRLVLFNPALAELTSLRPESLALRPTLFEFLDLLRDRRMVPEPKDYKAWRTRLTDAGAAGAGGLCESWALPDGRTFKVTALPQPQGATALLFEDITGQVVRNRRFRGTVDLQQQLLDQRDEAIAVFAPDGALALCNKAYDRLWQTDCSATLDPIRLSDSLAGWKAASAPAPEWDSFPPGAGAAAEGWTAQITALDGRRLTVDARALSGGNLAVEFKLLQNSPTLTRPAAHRLRLLA